MGQQHQPDRRAREHRPVATILAEIADVERHLREVPPHHGGGASDLAARADARRRELAAARSAARDGEGAATRAAQAAQAQQQ